MPDETDPLERLEQIDRELSRLPHGQLVVRRRGGEPWVFRLWKEGARTRSEAVGNVDGDEHRLLLAQLEMRRDLSRERRSLGRRYD